jgi:hypothetical protein
MVGNVEERADEVFFTTLMGVDRSGLVWVPVRLAQTLGHLARRPGLPNTPVQPTWILFEFGRLVG